MTNTVHNNRKHDSRIGGQTLIIAIIIMGVLLILGVAFSLIVKGAVDQSTDSLRRTLANDLAKLGVEFVHEEMLNSSADWAFTSTNPTIFPTQFTKDPDALYLRPASFLFFPSSSGNIVDMGGPDGLGPYMRIETDKGRALVRVRYAPSDYDAFADPTGALRRPGRARRFLIIESIGRPGRVVVGGRTDPTRQLNEAVWIQGFTQAEFGGALAHMHAVNNRIVPSRKMLAFATLGVGDYAMFITDKNNSSRPVEIGWPSAGAGATIPGSAGVGAFYNGSPVRVPLVFGRDFVEPNPGRAAGWQTVPGGGGFRSNAPLVVHGDWIMHFNAGLGQGLEVAGLISAANTGSSIEFSRTYYDASLDQWRSNLGGNLSTVNSPISLTAALMDSRSAAFSTWQYAIRDGVMQPDPDGYPRSVRPIQPPVIDRVDPQGRDYYYLEITRNSGRVINGRNIGQYGYGRGVYVDYMNPYNVQRRNDDDRDSNASNSLPDVWFNPNARDNTTKAGSWKGPYFVPDAAYLRLIPDGFEIIRPGNNGEQQNSEQAFWRDPLTGASTGMSTCRYRIRDIGGQVWILNSILHPNFVYQPSVSLSDADFVNNGLPFEGVIYFEGDVRVRGVIPTHHQLTVLSMGTIYIDGSITKGVVTEAGAVISTPSRSMISLMAKEHVAVNTTQFFAPSANDLYDTKDDSPLPDTPTPIELGVDGDGGVDPDVRLQIQLLLNNMWSPNAPLNPANPLTWRPFASGYASWTGANSVGSSLDVNMLIASSANDGGPAYVSMGILPLSYASPGAASETSYLFSRFLDFATAGAVIFNAADPFFTPGTKIPIYGLADPSVNVFPKFEIIEFPLVTASNFNYVAGVQRLIPVGGNPEGQYQPAINDETQIRLRNNAVGTAGQKEFLAARTAVTPHDVRIEASIYAQEGSYYVIPGPWFNMNTDDSRERFQIAVGLYGLDEAQRRRFESFGNTPSVPFNAEPIDCRVTIIGAISQNLPAPISRQAEWMQKWGWIPREIGGTGRLIPWQHVPFGIDLNTEDAVPNFIVIHDPALAGASADGINPLRRDALGRTLPPTPRLPVSPTLVYFGEVTP